MVLTHSEKKEYENDSGEPYWVSFEDSLSVESDKGKVYLSMCHSGSYTVRTAISLSKEEAKSLRDELDRLIKRD